MNFHTKCDDKGKTDHQIGRNILYDRSSDVQSLHKDKERLVAHSVDNLSSERTSSAHKHSSATHYGGVSEAKNPRLMNVTRLTDNTSTQSPFFSKYFAGNSSSFQHLHWKKVISGKSSASESQSNSVQDILCCNITADTTIASTSTSTTSGAVGQFGHSSGAFVRPKVGTSISQSQHISCETNTTKTMAAMDRTNQILQGSSTWTFPNGQQHPSESTPLFHQATTWNTMDIVSMDMSEAASVCKMAKQYAGDNHLTATGPDKQQQVGSWQFSECDHQKVSNSESDVSHKPSMTGECGRGSRTVKAKPETVVDEVPHSTNTPQTAARVDSGLCQVCEDIAAGFYCGAFVCEACKKFFIRASKQEKQKFVCLRQGTCKITKESRVQCQHCRYQKCLQLNMYYPGEGKRSVNSTHVSGIPCRVCGAPSSGFHFGALTCEGCKGFFRRMVKEREPGMYKCSLGGKCEISTHTRNMCKACRYTKCISIGMCVEGSRIGRQPNAVKHAISLEVKKQRMEQPVTVEDKTRSDRPSVCAEADGELAPSKAAPVMEHVPPSGSADMKVKEEPVVNLSLTDVELTEVSSGAFTIKQEPEFDDSEEEQLLWSLQQAGKELAHMNVNERAKMDTIDPAEFQSLPILWKKQMKHFDFHAKCVLRFSRRVPGFRELLLDDQVALVQSSIYPVVVLNHSRGYELETGFYNFFNFTKPEEEAILAIIPSYSTLQSHFKHTGVVTQSMKLTDLEYTLLSCLLLHNTECPGIKSVDQLVVQQSRIIRVFQKHLTKMYGDQGSTRFGELMLRISELTLASEQHIQTMSMFVAKHPYLEVPQLYKEMFFD